MKYFCFSLILILFLAFNVGAEINLDYELPEQLPSLGPGGGFEFGYFWPALGELNQELKSMGLRGMAGGAVYGGTFGYSFTPNFQIAYEGLGFSSQTSGIINNTVKAINISAGISNLAFIYKLPWGKVWNLSLGIAPGYYSVNYKKEITAGTYQYGDNQNAPTSVAELAGSAWGGKIFANLKYVFNPLIAFGLSVGYQYAKIKELYQVGVRMSQAPIIDLSGILIKLSAHLNF